MVNRCTAVIRHQNLGNPAEVFIHMYMGCNPGRLLFVDERFNIRILAVSHNTDEKISIDDLSGIRISDAGRIPCPINLYLFCRFPVDVHGCPPF